MESLIRWLSRSPNPYLARLFGTSSLLLKYSPLEQEAIIRQAEEQAYGPKGLVGYEEESISDLERLTRRTLAQFLCQRALRPTRWIQLLRFVGIGLALPFQLLWMLMQTLQNLQSTDIVKGKSDVVVFLMWERLRNVAIAAFPDEEIYLYEMKLVHLGRRELGFLLRILLIFPRFLLYPDLLSNILRWLSYYGYVTRYFDPHTIGNFFEGVASSSLITAYLNEHNIWHVNLMHGELFFSADCAFCEFNEFHVWGQHFKDLCVQRRNMVRRFVISGSPDHRYLFNCIRHSFQPRPKRLLIVHNVQFIVGSATFNSLLKVLHSLDSSWEVLVRPHPLNRQTWSGFLEAINTDIYLVNLGILAQEETQEHASLEAALEKSRVVVGSSSMTVIEAWIAGCKCIYLGGTVIRSTLLDRFSDSQNVIYVDTNTETRMINGFINEPAVLDPVEDEFVEYISNMHLNQQVNH